MVAVEVVVVGEERFAAVFVCQVPVALSLNSSLNLSLQNVTKSSAFSQDVSQSFIYQKITFSGATVLMV